jgi:hypothetical protein
MKKLKVFIGWRSIGYTILIELMKFHSLVNNMLLLERSIWYEAMVL